MIIENRLFQTGYPFTIIKGIQKEKHVNLIVNCCDVKNAFYERDCLSSTKVIYYPIIDYSIPKMETFYTLMDDLLEEYNKGTNILIHCMGGRGRSTIVSACLYGRIFNCSYEEAIEVIRSKRGPHIPETKQQEEFIKEYFTLVHLKL